MLILRILVQSRRSDGSVSVMTDVKEAGVCEHKEEAVQMDLIKTAVATALGKYGSTCERIAMQSSDQRLVGVTRRAIARNLKRKSNNEPNH